MFAENHDASHRGSTVISDMKVQAAHLLGKAQNGAVGGLVLEVGIIHGIARVCEGNAHRIRAVLLDRLLQRLEVACATVTNNSFATSQSNLSSKTRKSKTFLFSQAPYIHEWTCKVCA